ncbi:hypothetical protein F4778DRAFT_778981 [Xylariomycetidae sp. FL2044]|nr:hypothetical protein F4778DRAFT_778981 [Xylariomycetidae sp. FL2044]
MEECVDGSEELGFVFLMMLMQCPDYFVQMILRSPGFHRGVQRIHDTIHDRRYGRNPHEPLRQGEATREPSQAGNFFAHFIDELRNQFRGTPTNFTNSPPKDRQAKMRRED